MEYPIIHTMEQGSDEWKEKKLWHLSASKYKIAMSKGAGRKKLQDDLVEEFGTKRAKEGYRNDIMRRGNEREPDAIIKYQKDTGLIVEKIGFVELSEFLGVSPDGRCSPDGGVEIKSTIPATHQRYIEGNKLPTDHSAQVYGCMDALDAKWWDFVSYCPEYVIRPYWRIRVPRDELKIAEVRVKVDKFVDEMIVRIEKLAGPRF